MTPQPDSTVPSADFRYLRWVALTLGVIVVIVAGAAQFVPSLSTLSREGGVIEMLSVGFWAVAIIFSLATIYRWRERNDRLLAICLGTVALLAGLRELDLHHALGPDVFGAYGMRFRIRWWLDGDVSFVLKVGWLIIFAILGMMLGYPPWKVRPPLLTAARRGNAMVGWFILAVFFCGLGGFIDDQLRGTTFISGDLRGLTEETSEMVGALAYAVSAGLRWRYSYAAQLRSVGLPRGKGDL